MTNQVKGLFVVYIALLITFGVIFLVLKLMTWYWCDDLFSYSPACFLFPPISTPLN